MNSTAPAPNHNIYMTDLPESITTLEIVEFFKTNLHIDPTTNILQVTLKDKHSATVSFPFYQDAQSALQLNGSELSGQIIRISPFKNPRELDREANIFLSKMDITLNIKDLTEYFSQFGNLISIKIATENNGNSKGYGYVQFQNKEDAEKCIENSLHKVKDSKEVHVEQFIPRTDRELPEKKNLVIKGLPDDRQTDDLNNEIRKIFSDVGEIESSVVKFDANLKINIGYVCFKHTEQAERALANLNGKPLFSESTKNIQISYEMPKTQRFINQETNIYTKGLKITVTQSDIRNAFKKYGEINNIKLEMPKNKEIPSTQASQDYKNTKFALIDFSTKEEANNLLQHGPKDKDIKLLYEDEKQIPYITIHLTQKNRKQFNNAKNTSSSNNFYPPYVTMPPPMYPFFNPYMMMINNQFNDNTVAIPNNISHVPPFNVVPHNSQIPFNQPFPHMQIPPMIPFPPNGNSNLYNNNHSNQNNNSNNNRNRRDNNSNYQNNRTNNSRNNNNRNRESGGGQYIPKSEVIKIQQQTQQQLQQQPPTYNQNYNQVDPLRNDPVYKELEKAIATEEGKKKTREEFGIKFYDHVVKNIQKKERASQITGMIIDIDSVGLSQIYKMSLDNSLLVDKIQQAESILNNSPPQAN